MTDDALQGFELRLAATLDAYADGAGPLPDPFERAREIAASHPRRRTWFGRFETGLRLRPAWLVSLLVVALVAAALLIAGTRLLQRPAPIGGTVPFGRWVLTGLDGPYVDLNADPLLHAGGGAPIDVGRVVQFTPDAPGSFEGIVVIDGASGCGPGRYHLRVASSAGDPEIRSIRFTEPADDCARRVDLLIDGPWEPWVTPLEISDQGATYGSIDFTEPLELRLPPMGPPYERGIGGMYQRDTRGRLFISAVYWGGVFLDDEPVPRDLCDPEAGTLPDIPPTLDQVAAWLSTTDPVAYAGRTEITIDGRTALRWTTSTDCANRDPAAAPLGPIVYAIPTGDDVIIWTFYGDTDTELAIGDAVARAIHFK